MAGAQIQLASCYHLRLLIRLKQIAKAKTEIPKGPGTVFELKIQLTLFFSFLTEAGDLDHYHTGLFAFQSPKAIGEFPQEAAP